MSLIEETTARVREPQQNAFMGGEIAQAAVRAELKQAEFIRAVAATNWDTSDSEARVWDDATLTSGLDPLGAPAMTVRAGDVYYANLDPAWQG